MFRTILAGLFISIPVNPTLPPIKEKPNIPELQKLFTLNEEQNITITLGVADRESIIQVKTLVTEIEDEKYLYTYTIKNVGKYKIGFRWSIIDIISGAEVVVFLLEPDELRIVTIENKKMPVWFEGKCQIWLLVEPNDDIWKDDIKKANATISGNFMHPLVGNLKGPILSSIK